MTLPFKAARTQAERAVPLLARLEADVGAAHPLDQSLRRCFRDHPEFGSRDRRFFGDLAFAWFRWRGWLERLDPLRVALACCLDAAEVHPAAALLAERAAGGDPLEPLGERSLDEKARAVGRRLGGPPPPVGRLVPGWVPACLHVPEGGDRAAHGRRFTESCQLRPPVWLRAGGRDPAETRSRLQALGLAAAPHPRLAEAIRVEGRSFDGSRLPAPAVIQDLASQCVGRVCNPAPGEFWWDVCAGAGGKSLHLAELMAGRGSVLATDIRPGLVDELRRRAREVSARRIRSRAWDGREDPLPGRLFDGVLLDAPCSGLGTWARNPDARWRTDPGTVERRRRDQDALLASAARAVRPGGALVYAACTLAQDETVGLIEALLRARPEFRPDPVPHPLTSEPTGGLLWIWPWAHACNGMFIARLVRGVQPAS